MSRTWNPGPTYRPPALDGGVLHGCGCHSRSATRLQGVAGELRSTAAAAQQGDPFDLLIDVALIGGAAYLTYLLFFGDA